MSVQEALEMTRDTSFRLVVSGLSNGVRKIQVPIL
jgi:hypothetical protein